MSKKEYIEREGLLENLEERLSDLRFIVKYEKRHGSVSDIEKGKAKLETMKGVISLVKSQPAADVQEVRHGKWDEELYDIICSACKESFNIISNDVHRFDFCPNCGAKMDKE